MKRSVVLDVARHVLSTYGLDEWTVCLDTVPPGARMRMAQTRLFEKQIGIVFSFWHSAPDREAWRDELRSLILHEVAHVLVGVEEGHSEIWRDKYIDLLEEWFKPIQVAVMVSSCSEIPEDWIDNEWLPRHRHLFTVKGAAVSPLVEAAEVTRTLTLNITI